MHPKDLVAYFTKDAIDRSIDLNPLQVAESHFFDKPRRLGEEKKDYREQAIDFTTYNKLPYASTCNSIYNLAKRFIAITCSYCSGKTEAHGGGGNCDTMTVSYKCTNPMCGATHSLTFQHDGISSKPGEKK